MSKATVQWCICCRCRLKYKVCYSLSMILDVLDSMPGSPSEDRYIIRMTINMHTCMQKSMVQLVNLVNGPHTSQHIRMYMINRTQSLSTFPPNVCRRPCMGASFLELQTHNALHYNCHGSVGSKLSLCERF